MTTVLQQTSGGFPVTDWVIGISAIVSAISAVVMVVITYRLARYAYVTTQEGKKDRRKDVIIRALENLYSPLYAILPKGSSMEGGMQEKERERARIEIHCAYVFYESEYDRMLEILERFGHYIDPSTTYPHGYGDGLRDMLEKPTSKMHLFGKNFYGFNKDIMFFFYYVKQRRTELSEELRGLTS